MNIKKIILLTVLTLIFSSVSFTAMDGNAIYSLGDVNNDENIDASDASEILREYSAVSVSSSVLNESQCILADVNNDDKVDASDASAILAYYACVSTGNKISAYKYFRNSSETSIPEQTNPDDPYMPAFTGACDKRTVLQIGSYGNYKEITVYSHCWNDNTQKAYFDSNTSDSGESNWKEIENFNYPAFLKARKAEEGGGVDLNADISLSSIYYDCLRYATYIAETGKARYIPSWYTEEQCYEAGCTFYITGAYYWGEESSRYISNKIKWLETDESGSLVYTYSYIYE